ncbi:hypothetical protein MRY82_08135 [bacterium]|nr:hypothetical protein [bacterium]
MKLTQHFSSNFVTRLVQSRAALLLLILVQILIFTGPNLFSIVNYYPDALVNSVDGPTHQMFGEIYTQKLKEGGIKNLLSNKVPEIGYNARFPDKYPPLFHILCSILSIIFGLPWAIACMMIIFVCFLYLLYEIQQWFKYCIGPYSENIHISWFFWLTLSAVLFSDYSMPEKGVSYFSVIIVGLYAQLLFTCLFSTFTRLIIRSNINWINLAASTLFLSLCYWSNILAFPLSLSVLAYIIYTDRLKQFKRYIPFILALLSISPWLIPFTKITTFSPSKMKTMALYHYIEASLLYTYCLIILSLLYLRRFKYTIFWTIAFLFISQCIFWTLSHDFLRDFEVFNFLTNLPIQFSRYWPYVVIATFLVLAAEYKDNLKTSKLKCVSPLTLGIIFLGFNSLIFLSNYNTIFVNRHYHTENKALVHDIRQFQQQHSIYKDKVFMVPTFNDNWVARTVASDLKIQAVRSAIKIDFNGYHENSVIQQLIEPVRSQLILEKPGGLFYIPKYHNDLLLQSVGLDGYVEILNEFNIGFIACPTKAKKGLCATLKNTSHPLQIVSKSYWWTVYAVPLVHNNLRTPILLYAELGAKVRNSLSDMEFVTFYENILFSNKISEYKLYYMHPKFDDEAVACAIKHIHQNKGILILPEVYEQKIRALLKQHKINIKIFIENESQGGLKKINEHKNLGKTWIPKLKQYFIFDDAQFKIEHDRSLQIIETPFFKKPIFCR